MKRTPLLSVLLLSFLHLITTVELIAQDSATDRDSLLYRELDEVVISAQKAPVVLSDVRRSVEVIDRRQIEDSPAQDLASMLSGLRGVDIRSRGAYGMQADISIRGGTFDQTLVLLNGVNVTDPQTGHHNLNVPVDLQSIERIETLRGPGARIFGPNAFNGAINIITQEPGDTHLDVKITGGEHRLGSAGVSGGFESGPVTHHISLHGIRSDGYIDNTDFRAGNLYYRSQVDFDGGDLDLQAGYNDKAFGARGFYAVSFQNQFEQTRAGFASLRWLPEDRGDWTPSVYWRRHHDRYELFRDEAPGWYDEHNYHRTDILGASLNREISSQWGTSTLGLDYRYEHIYSNALGREMADPKSIAETDDAQYTHSYDRSGLSLMMEHSLDYGRLSASTGALVYANSDLDRNVTLFPGLDLGWRLHDEVQLYASANRTLRLPTFTDLFYSDPENQGNPDLTAEEAISAEAGIKTTWNGILWDTAVFRRWGRDMIDWVRSPGDEVWQSRNLTEVTISGIETGVRVPLGSVPSGYETRPSLSIQYAYLHADKFSDEFVSNYAMDHLNHKLDLSITHPVTSDGGVTLTGSRQDRAGSYMMYEDGEFTETQPFEPFWLLDVKAFYRIGAVRIFVEASNALDTHYVDVANIPRPGRWIRGGMEFGL